MPSSSRSATTTLPSPAPLSSSLTTTAPTPGRDARIHSAAAATSSTRCTSSRPSGTGTPARWNSRRPALLNASDRRSGAVPLTGMSSARATATSCSVTFHGSITAVRPSTRRRTSSSRSGRSSSFSARGRGESSSTATTCSRRPHPVGDVGWHERAVVGEHLGVRGQRADEHEVGVDPVEQQRGVEVAVLHGGQARAVVRQQRVAQAERRHGDHGVVPPGAGHVRREGVGQRRLQPVEVVHPHPPGAHHGARGRRRPPSTYPAPAASAASPSGRRGEPPQVAGGQHDEDRLGAAGAVGVGEPAELGRGHAGRSARRRRGRRRGGAGRLRRPAGRARRCGGGRCRPAGRSPGCMRCILPAVPSLRGRLTRSGRRQPPTG